MVAGSVASAALLAALAIIAGGHGSLLDLFAVAALAGIVASGSRLVQAALLPGLTDGPRQLASAGSVWQTLENGSFLAGSLLVGVAVSVASVEAAFALIAGASAVAALAFMAIAADAAPAHRTPLPDTTAARELLLGAHEIAADAKLRTAVGLLGALAVVDGMVDVLVVVVALRLVDIGAGGVGWLNAVWGAGGMGGSLAALALLGRGRFGTAVTGGILVLAVPLVILAAVPGEAVAFAAFVVFGVGLAMGETAGQTLVQRLASDEVLGRTFGVVEALRLLGTGAGAIAAPGLVAAMGIRGALVLTAALLPLLLIVQHDRVRHFDADVAVPLRELALLRSLDIFAPLPLATVETLALHVTTVPVAAGTPIIRRGEIGDRFYAILEGDVDVQPASGPPIGLSAGSYFGERALLYDAPRNADVTAHGDCVLAILAGDMFQVTVTHHPRSKRAADAVARERS
jgi:hypothetical protein